jgi:AcrR family transcriptional regulator
MEQRSTRERILDTSARLFAERGFSGTSIRDIAAELGIANPSIYHHFGSKQEILSELMAASGERMAAVLTQPATGDPEHDAMALISALLGALEPHSGIALAASRDPKLSKDIGAAIVAAEHMVRDVVKKLAVADHADVRTVMAIAAVQGIVKEVMLQAKSSAEFVALLGAKKSTIVSIAVRILRT